MEANNPKLILRTRTDHGDKTVVAALRLPADTGIPDTEQGVFADCAYTFSFEGIDFQGVNTVRTYINEEQEFSYFDGKTLIFPKNSDGFSGESRKIFSDLYGYVDIAIRFLGDGIDQTYHTGYIPVLVRRSKDAEAVRGMVRYIGEHAQELLAADRGARDVTGLRDGGRKSLSIQIKLAEEIATVFEQLYGHFVLNSRYTTQQAYRIDSVEKLRQIGAPTLRYIACHPEELQKTIGTGFPVGTDTYIPKKTLISTEEITMDIYENEAMVSFLLSVLKDLEDIGKKITTFLGTAAGMEEDEESSSEYVLSSIYIIGELRQQMDANRDRINRVIRRFEVLYHNYSDLYSLKGSRIDCTPKQTKIFEGVPQYNMAYTAMCRWFRFGVYDFSGEELVMTCQRISVLYETYTLARMLTAVTDSGYTLKDSRRFVYEEATRYYRNTLCKNTYAYVSGDRELTVYYQPLITTGAKQPVNGFTLYRNTSLSLADDKGRLGSSYTPDFLIKVKDAAGTRYKIYDSKYSDENTVMNYRVADCILKYLFSVSPSDSKERVDGLYIFYGRTDGRPERNLHDCEPAASPVSPEVRLIPLSEKDPTFGQQTGTENFLRTIAEGDRHG